MSEEKIDWQEVVDRNPQGYVELNDGRKATHGPIKSIKIDEATDMVVIELKWTAQISLGPMGLPDGDWTAVENESIVFPNLLVPFVIEDTPEKGPRVRFNALNILYFNPVEGFDPSGVKGL